MGGSASQRSIAASQPGAADTQFEDAFPLAGGAAALTLFATNELDDLQNGARGSGANGVMELVINVVTLTLSLFVLRETWVGRHAPIS
jgi:hypothetical protein